MFAYGYKKMTHYVQVYERKKATHDCFSSFFFVC